MSTRGVIYLASPMDTADCAEQAEAAADLLVVHGFGVFQPNKAWHLPINLDADDCGTVFAANLAALHACDGMLALLPPGTRSVGVPIEMTHMRSDSKGVYMVGPTSLVPKAMGVRCFDSATDAVLAMVKIQDERGAAAC